jgi:hypothetical protein
MTPFGFYLDDGSETVLLLNESFVRFNSKLMNLCISAIIIIITVMKTYTYDTSMWV